MNARVISLAISSLFVLPLAAPQTAPSASIVSASTAIAASAPTPVPALIPYSGSALDAQGKPLADSAAMTFLIYKDEQGGQPLFAETQAVAVDTTGHYKVQLGASLSSGIPIDLFSSGEARWIEVQIAGQPSQPRVLLVSVPYALKAADAATLGGLPASAFALAGSKNAVAATSGVSPDGATNVTTTGGVAGYLPEFSGAATIVDSPVFVSGADIGIGTATPTATLDVNGTTILNGATTINGATSITGALTLPATGTATASAGFNSEELKMYTSAYNSSTKAVVDPRFYWEAEVGANDTAAPTATLNLLSSTTTSGTTETGFHFNANGTLNFAPGQTFPGTGAGTITGVTATSPITGGGTTGSVSLGFNTSALETTLNAIYPQLTLANTFTGNNSFSGIQSFSKIGIGTTTPRSLLEGQATASKALGPVFTLTNTAGGLGAESALDFNTLLPSTSGTYNPMARIAAQDANSYSDNIIFQSNTPGAQNGGLQTNLEITSAGDVLINPAGGNPANATLSVNALESSPIAIAALGLYGDDGTAYPAIASTGVSYGADGGGDGGDFYGGDSLVVEGYGGNGIYAVEGTVQSDVVKGQVAQPSYAGNFDGDVTVTGTLTAATKDFKIDDPADPANKYLYHASVESSEMMNIYSGNVTTDELGVATVKLPGWFEVENTDFRYQLTTIGRDAHAWIATKVQNGSFQIATNATNVEVSWQITAVRQDAYAKAHPLVAEQEKPTRERGFYQNPELYGQPAEKQTEWGRRPKQMQHMKEFRDAQAAKAHARPFAESKAKPNPSAAVKP